MAFLHPASASFAARLRQMRAAQLAARAGGPLNLGGPYAEPLTPARPPSFPGWRQQRPVQTVSFVGMGEHGPPVPLSEVQAQQAAAAAAFYGAGKTPVTNPTLMAGGPPPPAAPPAGGYLTTGGKGYWRWLDAAGNPY